MRRTSIAVLAVLFAAAPALAQNIQPAEFIRACRTTAGTVDLGFRTSTIPCWSVSEMSAEYPDAKTVLGVVKTVATADTCIQSMMPMEVHVTLVAEPAVTQAALVMYDPAGNEFLMDWTEIVALGEECPEVPR